MKHFKKTYRRKRHSVSLLNAHIVFCIKYRRRVLTRRVFDALKASMKLTSGLLDIEIQAIETDGDHIHLMIAYPPNAKLSEIVRRLKGASSRLVRKMRFPEVLEKLWGNAFWSPSYFVVSCGGAPLDVVKSYVENQQAPGRNRNKIKACPRPSAPNRKNTLHPRTEVRGFGVIKG
jgi:putative transposase